MIDNFANQNIYDLYRKNYETDLLRAHHPERFGETLIGGEKKTYKRGYTQAELTPWIKHLLKEPH